MLADLTNHPAFAHKAITQGIIAKANVPGLGYLELDVMEMNCATLAMDLLVAECLRLNVEGFDDKPLRLNIFSNLASRAGHTSDAYRISGASTYSPLKSRLEANFNSAHVLINQRRFSQDLPDIIILTIDAVVSSPSAHDRVRFAGLDADALLPPQK